jgi:hypothetical protein
VTNRVLAPERLWRRPVAPSLPSAVVWLRGLLEREALPIVIVALWLGLLAFSLPLLVVEDSWLSFVDGRLIAQHGLPHVDTLTFWSLGRPWIDQQWGAHLVLYEAMAHGGLIAALLLVVALIAVALTVLAVAARKLGASPRSAAIGVALPLLGAPWLAQLRTQTIVLPFFAAVYALLAFDSRRKSRRVLWVLPLLVVWANLHGSVALGAGLAALYGLGLVRRSETRGRGALLVLGSPLTLLASPYGFRLVDYYHLMLFHPPLARYVVEWQPPAVQGPTVAFFISAFGAAALWGGHRRVLTRFETWAVPLLLLSALSAVRNGIWFELALAVTLPRLLDAAWPSRIESTPAVRRLNVVLGSLALAAVVGMFAVQAARGPGWLEKSHPSAAAASAVAAAAGPDGIVLSDDLHADWLLWQEPSLEGRIAYDVRFELFDAQELHQLDRLERASHPAWSRCGAIASVVTFPDRRISRLVRAEGVLAPGARTLASSADFVAVAQPAARSTRCRRL